MEVILTAAVAVVGTLLGAAATHLFALRERRRSAQVEQSDRLRAERLAVCAELAELLTHFRGVQRARRVLEVGAGNAAELAELKAEADRTRTSSRGAIFRLRLLGADPGLVALATDAREKAIDTHKPDADGRRRIEDARAAVDAFVEEAARRLAA
ncbi:hypothetical protein ACIRL2_43840 [Embleya sp. NPDC127516]|uniref:hypothetical protein n=1 Tax=Embleya sp. NPDC127516 TaxID=3363990 RepID=UPI00381D3681